MSPAGAGATWRVHGCTRAKLGSHVEHMVRALHKPILAVTQVFKMPERIMIAFDGGTVTRRGVQMVASSPLG